VEADRVDGEPVLIVDLEERAGRPQVVEPDRSALAPDTVGQTIVLKLDLIYLLGVVEYARPQLGPATVVPVLHYAGVAAAKDQVDLPVQSEAVDGAALALEAL